MGQQTFGSVAGYGWPIWTRLNTTEKIVSERINIDWLAALQPGQEWVAVLPYRNHRVGGRIVTARVVRRTAAQIVVLVGAEERRYRAKDGLQVGDRWEQLPLPATDETIELARRENRRLNMVTRLKGCNFDVLPYETVEAMFKLLPAKQTETA